MAVDEVPDEADPELASVRLDESVEPDDSVNPDESVTIGSEVVDENVDVGASPVDDDDDVLKSSPIALTQEVMPSTRVRYLGKERMGGPR